MSTPQEAQAVYLELFGNRQEENALAEHRRTVILKALQTARAEEREALFPMQDGPSIPWSLAETIYKAYSAVYGTEQSLQRLAERGGFGWAEVKHIFEACEKKLGRTATQAIRHAGGK